MYKSLILWLALDDDLDLLDFNLNCLYSNDLAMTYYLYDIVITQLVDILSNFSPWYHWYNGLILILVLSVCLSVKYCGLLVSEG